MSGSYLSVTAAITILDSAPIVHEYMTETHARITRNMAHIPVRNLQKQEFIEYKGGAETIHAVRFSYDDGSVREYDGRHWKRIQ